MRQKTKGGSLDMAELADVLGSIKNSWICFHKVVSHRQGEEGKVELRTSKPELCRRKKI